MKLLVSVRNLEEARMAVDAGVEIVDLKEPARGSLGAVSLEVARGIGRQLGQKTRLSLAFGELNDFDHITLFDRRLLGMFTFAKIGLAGCQSVRHWKSRWQDWAQRVGEYVSPVAVAYADHSNCRSPSVEEVVELAIDADARYFLIDTWKKDGRCLFDYLTTDQLNDLIQPLRTRQIQIAVAGSLMPGHLTHVSDIRPDIIAVRGAVCDQQNRNDQINPDMLCDFVGDLSTLYNPTGS